MKKIRSNSIEQTTPFLRWVSEGQIEQIHFATLEVLERTGVKVDHPEALQLLKDAGCIVNENRVRIPSWLVEECLRLAPRKIVVANRKGERVMPLEKNRTYFGTGSDLPFTIDLESGERRRSTKKDVELACRVMDFLPNYDFVMSYAIASDTSPRVSDLHQLEAMVANTYKPMIVTAHDEINMRAQLEMAALVVGGKEELRKNPFLILYSEPISPLVHTNDGVGKMFACFEYGVPVVYTPGVLSGATTPVTKAGTIVLMNAEALAGVVMAQLKQKGAPIIIGGGATPMDMRTTATLYGSPETMMNYAIMTQLSQFYGIPNFTEAGCVNSPIPDAQAGMEAGNGILMAQLMGANLVHDVGYLEGGKTGSLTFLAMCNDFMDNARYMGRGTRIDDETMAVDVIDEVGPGGNYVSHTHTFEHFRNEIWTSKQFNTSFWEVWEEQGSKSMEDRAEELAKDIVAKHTGELLDPAIRQGLNEIIEETDKQKATKRRRNREA
ncbi:trimethylamine:corrinoid methyltransferase [Desulfosporosinus orientis DSM 765]|uniref:Trimethylamine:corrinoid methyltransferase n=1 Tax=Desulfosporosinus orientis (strain ATCC 19365 / DSM 765 / NCIMB 8382 / VKM B-1628 / Singapore I) TaxID=768706 RepID=G7WJL0_DESOD|nr:trimethylamine methyltransferase family protein [Desulfosporosinus orientis]AET70447.1 trimethylamine:corrinoid methyltransferase [Desulfosporosinus orientis DSM 765]